MPTSDRYHDYLISRLKDPNYAAVYLETHFEQDGEEAEPELLLLALSNVAEAISGQKMTLEQEKVHYEKLNELLNKRGSDAIHGLANWLKALGLKLNVTVDKITKDESKKSSSPAELTVE
jgi:DNA-binding phage protein